MKKLLSKVQRKMLAVGFMLVLAALTGCSLLSLQNGTSASLFAVDSKNGNVYEIDTEKAQSASIPLVSIKQNATGEMIVNGTKAFIAVGSYNNTSPGLYWFDLSSSSPSVQKIGGNISAQYLCIASNNKGYVSTADYSGVYSNTVYGFNPSNPSAGLGSEVTGFDSGFYPQDLVFADDGNENGYVFVTDNANSKVYRLNAAGTAVDLSFVTSSGGTTGLLPGSYDWDDNGSDDAGVFVANTGGYDTNWNALPGSIDFIPLDASSGNDIVSVQKDLSVARLTAFDKNHLAGTNYSQTWIIDLTKPENDSGRLAEVKSNGASFGSLDANTYDGYAYVPDGMQTVYRFDSEGTVIAISVGTSGEMITNVAVRE